ncbi:MAG: aromatic ring-hydroxylating dioxygenase subunit alpha [Acidimicrobiia bacterium]|nr:aromatic ring-hydroxylating dioxygenase subunit alpha [Acidimicrobiia bacterium]
MTSSLIETVKQRAKDESQRTAHPADFPQLPPVPAARYGDREFFELERREVFGRSWLMVAHVDELPATGDFRLIDHLAKPIVLLRTDGGGVNAFLNTCTHRGAALVTDPSGHAGRRLTCPYHSWVYGLDGALLGYPETHNFPPLDKECLGLTPVRCETWGPLVFVNLDDDAPPLRQYLAQVGEDLSELGGLAGRLHLVERTAFDVDVNWKIPVDANIETYHVNTVHRDSAAKVLDQAATGIQLLGHGHSRMLITTHDGQSMGDLLPFPSLFDGVGDLPNAGTFSYHVFPNLSIVFSGMGFMFFITNWPSGPNSSEYHVHFCSSVPSDNDEATQLNTQFAAINRSVLLEDLSVLPGMQRSVDAGALDVVRLGYQERRIYYLHETIDRVIGVERVPGHLRVPAVLGDFIES